MTGKKKPCDVFIGIAAAGLALVLVPATIALIFCIGGLVWDFVQAPIGVKAVPQTMYGATATWFILPVFVLWTPFAAGATLLWLFYRRVVAKHAAPPLEMIVGKFWPKC